MAYDFVAASSQYLTSAQPVTNVPFTIVGWGYFAASTSQAHMAIQNKADSNRWVIFATSSLNIQIATSAGGTDAITSGATSANTWAHTAGVVASSNSRSVYINGGSKATNTTNFGNTNANELSIGARYSTSYGVFLNGRAAEVAVWNVALNDDEIASLAKGFKPSRIRPQSLVFYAPLIRDLQDTKGALAITNNNTATVAVHPRVI